MSVSLTSLIVLFLDTSRPMYKYDVHPSGNFSIGTSGISQKYWSLPKISHADEPRTETVVYIQSKSFQYCDHKK